MSKVDSSEFGSARPKIEWDDLEEDVAVVKLVGVERGEVDDADKPSGKRATLMLITEELGDKVLYLNKTQIDYLIAGLGSDDTDDWVGQQIPIERKRVPFGKESHKKVWVVHDSDWAEYMKPKRRAPAKKTAKRKRAR